jgi:hypothetical protein
MVVKDQNIVLKPRSVASMYVEESINCGARENGDLVRVPFLPILEGTILEWRA